MTCALSRVKQEGACASSAAQRITTVVCYSCCCHRKHLIGCRHKHDVRFVTCQTRRSVCVISS
ncbi:unnamed protein product, partial [Heterosigma akashiwo]